MTENCVICAQLKDIETSFYKFAAPQYDQPLPPAAAQLVVVKDLTLQDAENHHVRCCPQCGTLYRYDVSYEYHVNGSEDEERLERMPAVEVVEYIRERSRQLEKIRQEVDDWLYAAGSLGDYLDLGRPTPQEAEHAMEQMEEYRQHAERVSDQLQEQVDAYRQSCKAIIQDWTAVHMRACQFYLDTLPSEGIDVQTSRYVARTSQEAWQELLEGGETFIGDYPMWLEGYRQRVEHELLI